MKVFLSKKAEEKLLILLDYLTENWGLKSKIKFNEKLVERIFQISAHPYSCPKSDNKIGLHKCVVSKQTTFYYRIDKPKKEIEIITFFDSSQNPNKLK